MSSSKRRQQAINRRRWVHELAEKWERSRAQAQALCPCGWRAWLGRDASDAEREDYDRVVDEHFAFCEVDGEVPA